MYIQLVLISLSLIKNTEVSLKEIEKFLGSEQMDISYIKKGRAKDSDIAIQIKDGNFYWGSAKEEIVEQRDCHLSNINLSVRKGEFVALIGQFGSGKTSLINALLGEMKK
jgi:ABC-type multidrug transport system ATPase subunit